MKKFLDQEEAEQKKKELEDTLEFSDDFDNKDLITGINWLDTKNSYNKLKSDSKLKMGTKRWFFLSHSRDIIKGKPQLIHPTLQTIPLIRRIVRDRKGGLNNEGDIITTHKFIDDAYDKRYDGQFEASYSEDFWVYRIIGDDHKEYYVLSKKQLSNSHCSMSGMMINLDDVSEFSKSMKIKSIASIFILKEFEPNVKIISKEELVNYTKTTKIGEQQWFDHLGYHVENENLNNFPYDVQLLRSIFILSGKLTGYPLHLAIMGRPGTKKTAGHIETLSSKFDDDPMITEGGNSRIKGLSPSFKEKPANIGDLAKAERVGWIDEIGKMIENEVKIGHGQVNNILGELNFLLEHKKRTVSSGNDNGCIVQATAKFLFVTNSVGKKKSIHTHIGVIDPTMMSRVLWWIQDDEETEFALGPESIIDKDNNNSINPAVTMPTPRTPQTPISVLGLPYLPRDLVKRDDFLTLFDTSYSFLSDIDKLEVQKLVDMSVNLCEEPMKSSVWKPRAYHHVYLLVDGVTKHRCLFKDYDVSFKAKQEDYDAVERLLIRMVNGFNTSFINY